MATYTEYTLKSGIKWAVRGYLRTDDATGKQLEFNKRGFKTKKEAQAAYTRARNNFYNGNYQKDVLANLTYEQVYPEWFEQYKLDVKESTAYKTNHFFNLYILPVLGKYRIAKITKHKLQTFVNNLNKKLTSYRQIYNYARNIMFYAYNQDYIHQNVTEKVAIPKNKKKINYPSERVAYNNKPMIKKPENFYTRSELQQFLSLIDNNKDRQWYTFFRLLAFTGIRKGEALALTWKDINFKDKLITIDKILVRLANGKYTIQPPKT